MNLVATLKRERALVENLGGALEKAKHLAEFLSHQERLDVAESRAMIHDLASQTLALKRAVKHLSKFDQAARHLERKGPKVRTSTSFQKLFEEELAAIRSNEHRALREIHAAATVLHDLSRGPVDSASIGAAAYKLVEEFSKIDAILRIIRREIDEEIKLALN